MNSISELAGVEALINRYVNPENKDKYLDLLGIFLDRTEMQIFDSINNMINNEENLNGSDITGVLRELTIRQALLMLEHNFGLVFNSDADNYTIHQIHKLVYQLDFFVDVDEDRANEFMEMLNCEEDELLAFTSILIDIGVDEFFLLEHLEGIKTGYRDEYMKALSVIKDKTSTIDDVDVLKNIAITKVLNNLKAIHNDNEFSKCLNISLRTMNYLDLGTVLKELNTLKVKELNNTSLALEFISAYILLNDDTEELLSLYREQFLPGLEIEDYRAEQIYKEMALKYTEYEDKRIGRWMKENYSKQY